MAITDTQQLVQQFFTHLTNRDLPRLLTLFDQEVDWYIPGNKDLVPWTGRRKSLDEVEQFFQQLWLGTQPLSAKVDHMLTDGNVCVITGEFSTRMLFTGKIVDSLFCIQITFIEGLIVRYRLLEDTFAVSEAMSR